MIAHFPIHFKNGGTLIGLVSFFGRGVTGLDCSETSTGSNNGASNVKIIPIAILMQRVDSMPCRAAP